MFILILHIVLKETERLKKTNTELSPGPWRNGKQVLGSLEPDWTIYIYIPAGVVLTEKLHSKICQPRGAKTPHRRVLFSNWSRNILCPSPSRPQTKVLGGLFIAGPATAIASFYPQERLQYCIMTCCQRQTKHCLLL